MTAVKLKTTEKISDYSFHNIPYTVYGVRITDSTEHTQMKKLLVCILLRNSASIFEPSWFKNFESKISFAFSAASKIFFSLSTCVAGLFCCTFELSSVPLNAISYIAT